ncbi:MAG: hypothetical protein DRN07_06110 [Thermoplasmata archaeon]|nr:MAG: hypothetical protein DRN07_06110 [Thermoplasmata archaeon]
MKKRVSAVVQMAHHHSHPQHFKPRIHYDFMKSLAAVMAVVMLMSGTLAGMQTEQGGHPHTGTPSENEALCTETYDLLIITPSQFRDSLEPFQWHKEQHGVKTLVVTLDEIYGGTYFSVNGRDDAEKVKYFIKNAYDEWHITYVLLVGGRRPVMQETWWCPVRYSHCGVSSDWESKFLSDLYFADIYDEEGHFSSWDADGDGIFGEWTANGAEDSPIDLYPDVYVGRWPARFVSEVKVMVAKTIAYENNAHGQSWFNKMVCVAGDTYPDDLNPEWVGYEGEEGTQQAMNWMPGFEYVKLWTSEGTLTGPQDVINAISDGCGFLFFDGHGSPMSWATHPPSDHNTWIDGLKMYHMPMLNNKDMYPVCVVGGCHNSQFNISMFNWLKIYEGYAKWYEYVYKGETWFGCWSWLLARQSDGGSIATLGYSALGYTKEDKWELGGEGGASEWLDTHFFWEYGMNGTQVLGDIWGNTINGYLNTYPIDWNSPVESPSGIDAKTAQEWILIGDPSLMIGGYPG